MILLIGIFLMIIGLLGFICCCIMISSLKNYEEAERLTKYIEETKEIERVRKWKKRNKETKSIRKYQPDFYSECINIKENVYSENKINKILGEINNSIEEYRYKFHKLPILIIISKELEIFLRNQFNLINQIQCICINDNLIEFNKIFGINCTVSPILENLEFEVR